MSERMFPMLQGSSVPWSVMEPHEKQAERNHSQTLKRLAERGGLGAAEAWYIVNDMDWPKRPDFKDAEKKWQEYAERINLHFAELKSLRDESEKLKSRLRKVREDIEFIFDDKQDIDDNGGPNDAMKAMQAVEDIEEAKS